MKMHSTAHSARAAEAQTEKTSHSSVVSSSLVMFLGTFTSRILGMIRSPVLLTLVLGLNSPIANSFDIANKLPNIIFATIAGGLINAVLVPSIVKASENCADGGSAFINKLLTLSVTVLGVLTAVLTLATPLVVKTFASTMDAQWYSMTVFFTYWCLPQLFFYGLYAILGEILNAREKFGPGMWAPVLNNVVAIAGLLLLLLLFGRATAQSVGNPQAWQGARGLILAVFSTAGVASQALILFRFLHLVGIRFRPDFAWRNSGLGTAGRASLWVLFLTFISVIPTALETNVASGATQKALDAGTDTALVAGNAAYTVSFSICQLPTSLVTVSIATAMFTRLAKAAQKHDYVQMRRQAASTINTVSAFNFLAISLIAVLAMPVSRIFVPAGSQNEIVSLAFVVVPMSFTLLGAGATIVFNRVCYSFNDMRGAFFMALPAQFILAGGYLLCSLLPPVYTVSAIAAVMSVATATSGTLLFLRCRKLLQGIHGREILRTHLKLLAVTLLITVPFFAAVNVFAAHITQGGFFRSVIVILVVTPLMGTAFLALLKLFAIRELDAIIRALALIASKLGLKKIAAKIR